LNGVKIVPANLGLFFTPLTLAFWISDEGGWTGYGVKFSTNSFSEKEVQFLIDLLKNKFDLNCTKQLTGVKGRNQFQIYIKADSIKKLRDLILPVMHPSMHYKLGL
jgi:hypothetical protein